MSTNKTQNLNLHSWAPGDPFKRAEFNENWAALDENAGSTWDAVEALQSGKASTAALTALSAKVSEIVFGTYIGNGTAERTISLGRKPKIVLVEPMSGVRTINSESPYGGLAAQGYPATNGTHAVITLTATGFTVYKNASNSFSVYTNMADRTYYYLAIF